MSRFIGWLLAAAALGLAACGTVTVDQYADKKPAFVLDQFFAGKLVVKGAVYERSGAVTRRFTGDIVGSWEGTRGTLEEVFAWDDGEIQHRTWRLEKDGDRWLGMAGDVVGTAAGRGAGNAFNWNYTLRVKTGSGDIDVRMDDWIYQIDDTTVLNRTAMSWYGLHVGEVVLTITKS